MEILNQLADLTLKLPLFTGLIFIFVGCILYFAPPKKINWFYGYRTPRAMKTQERWDFAQSFSGKEIFRWGVLLVLVGLSGFFFQPDVETANVIAAILITVAVIALIARTEIALSRKFGKSE